MTKSKAKAKSHNKRNSPRSGKPGSGSLTSKSRPSRPGSAQSATGKPGEKHTGRRPGKHAGKASAFRRPPSQYDETTAPPREPLKHEPGLAAAQQKTADAIKGWLKQSEELHAERHRQAQKKAQSATTNNPGLELDPWQQDVFDALNTGESVIVDAPTTAGKTRAVEAFFRAHINDPNFRAAYTTPVKSLSTDKLREFRAMFGVENVGIATGDVKENLQAPIVVATLESYRNSLLGVEPDLGRTLVVFDEYHYLQDESRGSAWEEAIILTPNTCQILMLSASVANAEQFVDWLNQLNPRKTAVLVRTEVRPVPLVHLIWYHSGFLLPETIPPQAFRNLDRQRLQVPPRQEDLAERLVTLVDMQLTPCIAYVGRRLACETLAGLLCRLLPKLDATQSAAIGESLQASHAESGALSFIHPRLRQMLQVYGVGFHHSGLAAPARMAIEALVKNGLLRYCTATMGLSLGINFSVRSAIITDYQRPGEAGFTQYAPSEVLQMLGRAGRRGKDVVGISLWPHVEAHSKLGHAKREAITSRLRNDPTTFLGLVGRGFSLRAIEGFYNKSFQRFIDKRTDYSLMSKSRWEKHLQADIPCSSPVAEYANFNRSAKTPPPTGSAQKTPSLCLECPHRSACHSLLGGKQRDQQSPLAALHLHLHMIGALNADESLSSFGQIARYFPQSGGLLIARRLAAILPSVENFTAEKITQVAELAAALAMARFKEPGFDSHYRFPFQAAELEKELQELYPYKLFEEVYDPPFGRRAEAVIREFNPQAAYIVKAWVQGMEWKELVVKVTHEQFGVGDLMSLLYRVATYLQSIIQADIPELEKAARGLRDVILREPLAFALNV